MRAATLAFAALVALPVLWLGLPHARASALPQMDSRLFLVKANDQAVISAGTWAWTGCGITTSPADIDQVGPCKPGQARIYASFFTMQHDIAAGRLTRGATVIFDQEGWGITPAAERAHPFLFLRKAALLARGNGITIIEAPVGRSDRPLPPHAGAAERAVAAAQVAASQLAEEVYAARFADYVELQDQYADGDPARYIALVVRAVAAIRMVSRVPVLAGLATDAGGVPVTAAQMLAEYKGAWPLVAGFWLNANLWPAPKGSGCAPQGCPLTARAFLDLVGRL